MYSRRVIAGTLGVSWQALSACTIALTFNVLYQAATPPNADDLARRAALGVLRRCIGVVRRLAVHVGLAPAPILAVLFEEHHNRLDADLLSDEQAAALREHAVGLGWAWSPVQVELNPKP